MRDNYNCFSYNVMKYLGMNGIEPIHVMIHKDTKRTFWIFDKSDDRLNILLKQWSARKAN